MTLIVTNTPISRGIFWTHALELFRQSPWYIWGGGDPRIVPGEKRWPTGGLDCSHFFTYLLQSLGGPDLRATHNTDLLFAQLAPTTTPHVGDLVFYRGKVPKSPDDVEHMMIYAGADTVLGMSYGGPANTSVDYSQKHDHRARVHHSVNYRDGFAGFRSAPVT